MSWRALFLGMAGGLLIAAFGYLNDSVLRLNFLVGNHFPISMFGGLVVVAMGLNPLLRRLAPSAPLRPAEMAVIMALMLVACAIPGSGIMRKFTHIVAMPAHFGKTEAAWQENGVLDRAPPAMILEGGKYDDESIGRYVRGTPNARRTVAFGNVPWSHWARPLGVWIPLILLFGVAVICLSMVVHTQWSVNEILPYPIVHFARTVMGSGQQGQGLSLASNRLFWLGLAAVFTLHLNNGMCVWFPGKLVPVPLYFDFGPLGDIWPKLRAAHGSWGLFGARIYPTVIAFAFFLATDVSLSLGLTQLVAVPVIAMLLSLGVEVSTSFAGDSIISWQMFGSYMALALVMLYGGRHYYGRVFRRGITFAGPVEGVPSYALWAFRILVVACALLAALLISLGLQWPFAVLLIGMALLAFLVASRINAECGVFHIEANWNAMAVLLGLFGATALGPKAIVMLGLVCAVLTLDYRETLMPFVVNGLKLCDDTRVRLGRVGAAAAVMFAIGLAVAVPVVLGATYTGGAPMGDSWGVSIVPRLPFDTASREMTRMRGSGLLEVSQQYTSLERLANLSPEPAFLWAAGIGIVLVLVFSAMRMRFPGWPLHPVLFLTWCTYPMMMFSHSFFIGWLVKKGVMKTGGQKLCNRLGPLMIGVIAGDLLGGGLFMVAGAIYHAVTGTVPPGYSVFPA